MIFEESMMNTKINVSLLYQPEQLYTPSTLKQSLTTQTAYVEELLYLELSAFMLLIRTLCQFCCTQKGNQHCYYFISITKWTLLFLGIWQHLFFHAGQLQIELLSRFGKKLSRESRADELIKLSPLTLWKYYTCSAFRIESLLCSCTLPQEYWTTINTHSIFIADWLWPEYERRHASAKVRENTVWWIQIVTLDCLLQKGHKESFSNIHLIAIKSMGWKQEFSQTLEITCTCEPLNSSNSLLVVTNTQLWGCKDKILDKKEKIILQLVIHSN